MINRFERIVFEPDQRLLVLKDAGLTPRDMRRRAAAWRSLGYHLEACYRARNFTGAWASVLLAICTVVAEGTSGVGAITGSVGLTSYLWANGLLLAVPLPVLALTALAASLGLYLTKHAWRRIWELSDRHDEESQWLADARADFFANLWGEIEDWNREVVRLNGVVSMLNTGLIASGDVSQELARARLHGAKLLQKLNFALEQMAVGELGDCLVASLDPSSLLADYGPRKAEQTELSPVVRWADRLDNAVQEAFNSGDRVLECLLGKRRP